jgi:hypothetical protein
MYHIWQTPRDEPGAMRSLIISDLDGNLIVKFIVPEGVFVASKYERHMKMSCCWTPHAHGFSWVVDRIAIPILVHAT